MALKLYEEFAIIDRYVRVIAETCSPNAGETERQINDRYSFTTTKNTKMDNRVPKKANLDHFEFSRIS